ncbi:MAG: metallophosphoesterase [Campylobacterota bacterium]|nr:metallophosphoesterase [Campylobacterota bacterium]
MTPVLYVKFFIFYGSWLVFPLLLWFIKKRWIILIFLSILFIYARFVEPKLLFVNHYKIQTGFKAKYALIADIHLGIYNNESILERTVEKINAEDIDAVLIAGDLTYEPQFDDMKTLFASLSKIKVPIYAVLGNHDCEKPGPQIRDELEQVLTELGVKVITNRPIELNGITILGLGSHWARDDEVSLLDTYTKKDNVVVLTHNPDTTLNYLSKHFPDLTLTGHTHGGQVRIPYIYKKVIPVRGDVLWDQGLYQYKNGQVFVASGIGEIGLPLRFLIPPTIDVLELY